MKNGKTIELHNMTDEHLNNAIALVERKEPNNCWVKILKQEKKYRELKQKTKNIKSELNRMKEIENIVF